MMFTVMSSKYSHFDFSLFSVFGVYYVVELLVSFQTAHN